MLLTTVSIISYVSMPHGIAAYCSKQGTAVIYSD